MREAFSGVVVIDSIEHATFYALLEFLYTGTLDHTCSNRQGSREEKNLPTTYFYAVTGQVFMQADGLVDLLQIADQYQLERLKYLCERKIIGYVDAENVVNLHLLSEQVQAPDLAKHTLEYLAKNWAALREQLQGVASLGKEQTERIERVWRKRYGGDDGKAQSSAKAGREEATVLNES
jgi:speckle-type POZ protein